MKLSNKAKKVACWLRDNPHHYASWEPQHLWPKCTHMIVRGDGCELSIPAKVSDELKGLLDYSTEEYMFYPKPELLQLINPETNSLKG